MLLANLAKGAAAFVEQVNDAHRSDAIAQGEPVRVVAHGPWGADPILVQIGSTRFALRRQEASRVTVSLEA
jgi:ferrous iron transport protein A